MEKKMALSNKQASQWIRDNKEVSGKFYWEDDVKEFIKELKEATNKIGCDCTWCTHGTDIINKLAGSKLI